LPSRPSLASRRTIPKQSTCRTNPCRARQTRWPSIKTSFASNTPRRLAVKRAPRLRCPWGHENMRSHALRLNVFPLHDVKRYAQNAQGALRNSVS